MKTRRKIVRAKFVILCAVVLGFMTHAAKAVEWEKIGDDDGVQVFRRDVAGSPVVAFRGIGVVDASVPKVMNVLLDYDHVTEWADSVAESKIVKKISPNYFYEYDHIETPFVMKDREFLIDVKIDVDKAKKIATFTSKSVDDPAFPPNPKFVRGRMMESQFSLESIEHGTKTKIDVEVHVDPMGSVPKWIVNMFQKDWPHNTIDAIRKQVKKPFVVEQAEYKKYFTER